MQNPTDSSRTPKSRSPKHRAPKPPADRLRALRPTRPVVMVAGIAALATATGMGIASGAPAADASHIAAVALAADGTPGTSPEAAAVQAAAERGDAAAARSQEREPLAADAPGSSPGSNASDVSYVLAAKQHTKAQEVLAAAEQKAAAEAAERARVEAEQKAAADRAAADRAAADRAAADRAAADQAAAAAAAAAAAKAQAPAASAPAAPAAAPAVSGSGYVRPVAGAGHGSYGRSGSLWSHGHTGEDFSAGMGSSVKAVTSGTVVKTGWGGAYGNEVVIKHPDGKYTQYGHLSKFSVSAGQKVTTGQQIGLSGSTGNSTGPHLHFEVRTGPGYGSDVNPIAYLRAKGVAI